LRVPVSLETRAMWERRFEVRREEMIENLEAFDLVEVDVIPQG
jgi:hypothetical protein